MAFNIVGLFADPSDAQAAVLALHEAGFSGADISFVGHRVAGDDAVAPTEAAAGAALGAGGGALLGGLAGLLVGLGTLVIPGVGPVIAAGSFAAVLGPTVAGTGVGAAAGGLVGTLVGAGVPEADAELYADVLERGGSLLAVDAETEQEADRAAFIMSRHQVAALDWQREAAHAVDGAARGRPPTVG